MSKKECPLCKKEVSYAGFHKHIFSFEHQEQLKNLVVSRKEHIQKYIDAKDHKAMTYVIPDPKKATSALKVCFGCKTAYHSKCYHVEHTCSHQKDNLECLKRMIAVTQPTQPVVDFTEVERWKKRVEQVEANLKTSEKDYDEEMEKTGNMACLITAILKKYKAGVSYDDMKIQLEDEHSDIYDDIMLELNTVEGEEL